MEEFFLPVKLTAGADKASMVRGEIAVIFGWSSLITVSLLQGRIAVTKQCTAKWHKIVNAVFRIVQNHGE